jgi:hypothetical protein
MTFFYGLETIFYFAVSHLASFLILDHPLCGRAPPSALQRLRKWGGGLLQVRLRSG